MASFVVCAKCGAKLTTKSPIAPGKKMKCPKCKEVFVVAEAEDEAADEEVEGGDEEETPKKKKPAKAKQADDDDQDEEVDDEEKPANRKQPIKMLVRRTVNGKILSTEADPKKLPREEGLSAINPSQDLLWTLNLAPGEEKTLRYRYSFLVGEGRAHW